ncbi:hypothetical protein F503_05747 [Ophiostoma piceae UAMH 11346]|uniref:Uncharacterized protein n=1 Tax=Ophiostoma piceae (strain UAMH 11346) TaxID=1262450 RepID=S3CCJ6_OPHP1|nr:hypothetical protein F503_05747 [Ophiostoma piceae UAMH 11346]
MSLSTMQQQRPAYFVGYGRLTTDSSVHILEATTEYKKPPSSSYKISGNAVCWYITQSRYYEFHDTDYPYLIWTGKKLDLGTEKRLSMTARH